MCHDVGMSLIDSVIDQTYLFGTCQFTWFKLSNDIALSLIDSFTAFSSNMYTHVYNY